MRQYKYRNNYLLLRLKKNKYVVKKNVWSQIYDIKLFIIIDRYNRVIGYAEYNEDNYIQIVGNEYYPNDLKGIISKKKVKQLNYQDRYMIFRVNNYKCLDEPLQLKRKVAGSRRPSNHEISIIKEHIIHDIIRKQNLTIDDILENTPKYQKIYKYCVDHELDYRLSKIIQKMITEI